MPLDLQQIPMAYEVQADDIADLSGQNRVKGIHPIPDPDHPSVVILCTIEGGDYPDRWLDADHARLRYCMEGRLNKETGIKTYNHKYQTNQAVINSREQGYPVHVFWRHKKGQKFAYAGQFVFERTDHDGTTLAFILTKCEAAQAFREEAEEAAVAADQHGAFDPANLQDARKRTLATIVRRQGQPAFRQSLLQAYGGKCAVTGCDLPDALEAAHISPYKGPETNHPNNGLILRSDIHTLFDLGLIAVDGASMTLLIAAKLIGTAYDGLAGAPLRLPANPSLRPNQAALNQHRQWAGF